MGHILRWNRLAKHVIEGKMEGKVKVTGRRRKRRKQILDDLKKMRRYWKMKEEALDHSCGDHALEEPEVRETTEWI